MTPDGETLFKVAASRLLQIPQPLWLDLITRLGPEGLMRMPANEVLRVADGVSGLNDVLSHREILIEESRTELEFVNRHNVSCIFFTDPEYPVRLRELPDAPRMLFMLGEADLNPERALSWVGTRRSTPYGIRCTEEFISQLHDLCGPVTIVSGLAFGIDAAAHNTALKQNMPTIGILAHGLEMIYPAAHRDLARRIIQKGGALITEYRHHVKPFRSNFLNRNRIVAGMSDVTVVAESPIRSGALNTASLADGYSREVMAIPGRISDTISEGCNKLIATHRASICCNAESIVVQAGWQLRKQNKKVQEERLPLLPEDENMQQILKTLHESENPLHIDIIGVRTGIATPQLLALISEMEFDGYIQRLPGNHFEVI